MNHAVSERRGLNAPFFGIVDDKFTVAAMSVSLSFKFVFQFQQIFLKIEAEFQDFVAVPLAFSRFPVSRMQIFKGIDFFKHFGRAFLRTEGPDAGKGRNVSGLRTPASPRFGPAFYLEQNLFPLIYV